MSTAREDLVRVVRDVLGPLIRADQGVLYLVEVTERSVALHLGGRYSGCAGNTLTRRRVLEPALQTVAPGVELVITSGAIVPEGATALL